MISFLGNLESCLLCLPLLKALWIGFSTLLELFFSKLQMTPPDLFYWMCSVLTTTPLSSPFWTTLLFGPLVLFSSSFLSFSTVLSAFINSLLCCLKTWSDFWASDQETNFQLSFSSTCSILTYFWLSLFAKHAFPSVFLKKYLFICLPMPDLSCNTRHIWSLLQHSWSFNCSLWESFSCSMQTLAGCGI